MSLTSELLISDLAPSFDESAPYPGSSARSYIALDDLTPTEKQLLSKVKIGLTLRQAGHFLALNGGLTSSGEFYLMGKGLTRAVAVRLALRPPEMSEAIFWDKERRLAWLRKHPYPESDKVIIMRVSKPFLTQIAID